MKISDVIHLFVGVNPLTRSFLSLPDQSHKGVVIATAKVVTHYTNDARSGIDDLIVIDEKWCRHLGQPGINFNDHPVYHGHPIIDPDLEKSWPSLYTHII